MNPASSPAGEKGFDLAPFKELLLASCGHSFEAGREKSLSAALARRMTALNVSGHQSYHARLLSDPDELLRLTELLTVNETYFFREPEHLNLMVDTLLPRLLAERRPGPVRILSAGCSTGEEPYSVAIMLRERFGPDSERLFAITGVDIDSAVIAAAKQGAYGKGSFRDMDRSLLERYFDPCGPERLQVKEGIRTRVRFELANLVGGSYPPGMQAPDVILYRNVSIYFPPPVQREIFGRLAELLADGGALLVGATETMHHDLGILPLVRQDALFYFRKVALPGIGERRALRRHVPTPDPVRREGAQAASVSAAGPVPRPQRTQPAPRQKGPGEAAASQPPDVRAQFDAALELARNRQHEEALALLDAIVARDGTFLKAYSLKGSLLLGISRFDEAGSACRAVLDRDPLCLEGYLMLGIIARQRGDDDEALRRFREAIYLDASCWPAHFYSGEIGSARQDEKRARNGYETALRVLEQGTLDQQGERFFPLSFNAEQFRLICRHKLAQLKKNG